MPASHTSGDPTKTHKVEIEMLPFGVARLLIAYYEFGHGLISAAACSVGACAKATRFLQLLRQSNDNENPIAAQEQRRTWWALFNLDRYLIPDPPAVKRMRC